MYKCQNLDYCGVLPGKNMYGVVHLFAKKYSVLIVASPMPLRSSLVVGKWLRLLSWSKISTRERKCDKQSVALWTLCEALFFRGHCGVTLENSFFFPVTPKSLKPTKCCKIPEKSLILASFMSPTFLFHLGGTLGIGGSKSGNEMKNDLVDEKYESLESFLSCHLHWR